MSIRIESFIPANPGNFNQNRRSLSKIKYIVIHYTGNVHDTALNNLKYYAENDRGASAHYYCDDSGIYQSVPLEHAAYAVGLGGMSKPYIANPPFYKKATNTNSVSIEICGSRSSSEGSEQTKENAARLCACLMKELNIPITNVIRHYDVTGKKCPRWAVDNPSKWDIFRLEVFSICGGITMSIQEFRKLYKMYMEELGKEKATAEWEINAMEEAKNNGLINDSRPHVPVTRGELAAVIQRLEARLHEQISK